MEYYKCRLKRHKCSDSSNYEDNGVKRIIMSIEIVDEAEEHDEDQLDHDDSEREDSEIEESEADGEGSGEEKRKEEEEVAEEYSSEDEPDEEVLSQVSALRERWKRNLLLSQGINPNMLPIMSNIYNPPVNIQTITTSFIQTHPMIWNTAIYSGVQNSPQPILPVTPFLVNQTNVNPFLFGTQPIFPLPQPQINPNFYFGHPSLYTDDSLLYSTQRTQPTTHYSVLSFLNQPPQ